jgi:16S rRNA (guanine966-N2)-methyltransferase
MLGPLDEATVLDLFAGTGALGIEALSRGAARAVFVEQDAAALKVLERNLQALALSPSDVEVRRGDALGALRMALDRKETYDLVLVDPPYRQAPDWGPRLWAVLPVLLSPAARVVVESDRRAPAQLALEIEQERRYGDTSIRIHRNQ